jgi:hypothetical protein
MLENGKNSVLNLIVLKELYFRVIVLSLSLLSRCGCVLFLR